MQAITGRYKIESNSKMYSNAIMNYFSEELGFNTLCKMENQSFNEQVS